MIPFEAFFLTYELLNANCLLPPRLVNAPRWRPRDLQSPASSTSSDLGVRTLLGFSVDGFGSSASQDSEVGGALFALFCPFVLIHSMRSTLYSRTRTRSRHRHTERASSAAALRARTTEIEGAAWCDLGLLEWMYLLFRVRWGKALKQCDATEEGIKKSKTLARYLCNVPSFLDFLIFFNTWKKTTNQFFIRAAMFSCFEKLKWSSTNITSISGWMVQTIIHFYHIGRKLSH